MSNADDQSPQRFEHLSFVRSDMSSLLSHIVAQEKNGFELVQVLPCDGEWRALMKRPVNDPVDALKKQMDKITGQLHDLIELGEEQARKNSGSSTKVVS